MNARLGRFLLTLLSELAIWIICFFIFCGIYMFYQFDWVWLAGGALIGRYLSLLWKVSE